MSGLNTLPLALGLLIFSFLVSGVAVVPFINLLYRIRAIRRTQAHKSDKSATLKTFNRLHDIKAGTPIGGGVLLIVIVTLLFTFLFPFSSHMGVKIASSYNLRSELFVIFFTFLSFGLVGLIDDFSKIFGKPTSGLLGPNFGLKTIHKFGLQWICAFVVGFVIYKYLGISFIHIPLVNINFSLGIWYIPFAALVIVSFANAFNITDGLDGLSCGLLAICLMAFWVIVAGNLDTPLSLFIALWIGALIAFLYFNVWPARIFLGDAGALSFGAMLAVIGLLTGSLVALVVIGGIFVIEIVSSAVQIFGWRVLKRPIFPLAPIHHTFLAIGWEEPKIVMRAWLAGLMLAIFGLWLATI